MLVILTISVVPVGEYGTVTFMLHRIVGVAYMLYYVLVSVSISVKCVV